VLGMEVQIGYGSMFSHDKSAPKRLIGPRRVRCGRFEGRPGASTTPRASSRGRCIPSR
jgi:hypothetical protein